MGFTCKKKFEYKYELVFIVLYEKSVYCKKFLKNLLGWGLK